jgi:hypothetical protein
MYEQNGNVEGDDEGSSVEANEQEANACKPSILVFHTLGGSGPGTATSHTCRDIRPRQKHS